MEEYSNLPITSYTAVVYLFFVTTKLNFKESKNKLAPKTVLREAVTTKTKNCHDYSTDISTKMTIYSANKQSAVPLL